MIRILLLFVLLHSALFLSAQINPDSVQRGSADDSVFFSEPSSVIKEKVPHLGKVVTEASFPKENGSLASFIQNNIKASRKTFKSYKQFYAFFSVDTDGCVFNVSFKGGENCPDCIKVLHDVFKKMPKWSPAIHNGTPVIRKLSLRINIQ